MVIYRVSLSSSNSSIQVFELMNIQAENAARLHWDTQQYLVLSGEKDISVVQLEYKKNEKQELRAEIVSQNRKSLSAPIQSIQYSRAHNLFYLLMGRQNVVLMNAPDLADLGQLTVNQQQDCLALLHYDPSSQAISAAEDIIVTLHDNLVACVWQVVKNEKNLFEHS